MSDTQWVLDAFNWCTNHWAFCAFVISILFEIPHWKLKPFTALLRVIGKMMNRPLIDEMQKLDQKVDGIKDDVDHLKDALRDLRVDVDRNEMDMIRATVLDFGNSCRNGHPHSKEEFDYIVALNDKYVALLKKYDIKNGVYEADYEHILRERQRCQDTNSFLA